LGLAIRNCWVCVNLFETCIVSSESYYQLYRSRGRFNYTGGQVLGVGLGDLYYLEVYKEDNSRRILHACMHVITRSQTFLVAV
jgi:hypothetical protein